MLGKTTTLVLLATLGASPAWAVNSTWTNQPGGADTSASGSWNDSANWATGTIADGSGFTADFSTLDIAGTGTGSNVITLDAPRTIGNLIFGNTNTATAGSWNVSDTTNDLTLAGATPTITVNSLGSNGFVRINATIGGTDGLVKDGSGLLMLAGSNTYTGLTTVSSGTIRLLNTNAVNGDIALDGGGLSVDNVSVTLDGNITGTGSVTKTNNSSTLTLSGDNTFSGGVTLVDGAVALGDGVNNGLGTGTFNIRRGTVRSTDDNARTITNTLSFTNGSGSFRFGATSGATSGRGDLTFTYAGTTSMGASRTFTVDNDTVVTFNNNFTANPGWTFSKSGTGTLVFNGGIGGNFNGTVTVNTGTFIMNGDKTGGGDVNVTDGGTLGGTGSLDGVATFAAGSTFQAMIDGPLEFTDTVNIDSGAVIATLDTLTDSSYTVMTFGTGSLTGTFTVDTSISSQGYSVVYNDDSITLVVPEPATMLLVGLGGLLVLGRRKQWADVK